MSVLPRKYYRVYSKTSWDRNPATWVLRPTWEQLTINRQCAPSVGSAKVRLRYGDIIWEDLADGYDGSEMQALTGLYIRITVCDNAAGDNEKILFVGIVPTEEFGPAGQNAAGYKSAVQVVNAYDLKYVLDRPVHSALVVDSTGIKKIDRTAVFNRRTRTGGIQGNMSYDAYKFDGTDAKTVPPSLRDNISSKVFELADWQSGDPYAVWDYWEILWYIQHFIPEALAAVYSFTTEMEVYLKALKSVHSFKSVAGTLNELINPARGIGWDLLVGIDDKVTVAIYSMMDAAVTVGTGDDAITVPASGVTQSVNYWSDPDKTRIEIFRDSSALVDKITVVGELIKVCGTFMIAEGTLEPGWKEADETLYKDASRNTTGYADLSDDEKAAKNDAFRGSDKLGKVYTSFVLPKEFNWLLKDASGGSVILNPQWDPEDGEFLLSQAGYWNCDNRFLPYLPFKEGFDYIDAEPVNNNDPSIEPDWRKLMVLVKKDDRFMYVDRMVLRHEGIVSQIGATVRCADDAAGVIVRSNPNHVLALNHFDPETAEPSAMDDEGKMVDYETIAVTAMLETDQLFRLEHETGFSIGRELTIRADGAELWRVAADTIVDIDADGQPELFACTNPDLRNDIDILRSILTAAVVWHGRPHYRGSIIHNQADAITNIGTMLSNIDIEKGDGRGACVTGIKYEFFDNGSKTTVTCGYAELDVKTLVINQAANVRAMPGGIVRPIDRSVSTNVQQQIDDLKREINAITRIPVGGSSNQSSTQYAIVTEAPEYNNETQNRFVVQKASKNTAGQWEGDGTDIVIERALGFEGFVEHEGNNNAKDIRNWSPWPAVGAVIEITERWDAEQTTPAKRWYMIGNNTPCIYGGSESNASLRVDDETLLTQAVWV